MLSRSARIALGALLAGSSANAQAGSTLAPRPAGPIAGEASGTSTARPRVVPHVEENQPIPSVRPLFDLSRTGLEGAQKGTERWMITFYRRSFDLTEFRTAIYTGASAETVEQIVAGLGQKLIADQDAFAREIGRLGGRVSHQWWIINGCAVEVPRAALPIIAAMPNVATLDPDRTVEPTLDPRVPVVPMILTATNASNHNADVVQARGFDGSDVGIAIVDTGQDSSMAGSGIPHRVYFKDGSKPGTNLLRANNKVGGQPADDTHGHGTGVASIAAGAGWNNASADRGHAFNAVKIGYSICDVPGSCSSNLTTQASAWNMVAADKATHGIVAANMSYGSSPSPTDVSQQALDACALHADVLITSSAGNNAASTAGSSSCANGLAVAACNPTSKTMANASSRGPLSGDSARYYPDITACGVDTVMALRDDESGNYTNSGTSMAAPQVSGAATLIRSADRSLTALETKAILLCTTESIAAQNPAAPYNSRNSYGMGFLRDDLAMNQALREISAFTDTISTPSPRPVLMRVTSGRQYTVVLAWHRTNLQSTIWNNLNLEVLNGATSVASSTSTRNLYEKVAFTSPITGYLSIQVTAAGALNPNPQTYAICHDGDVEYVILPAAAAGTMGNTNDNVPFSSRPTRYQQIFLGAEVGPEETFHYLGLRQDEAFQSLAGATVDLELKLGYSTLTPATLTTNFGNNLAAGQATVVAARRNFVLPPLPPASNKNPKLFFLTLPFSTPFPWAPVAGRNLIVDVTQRGNSRGNTSFSYPLDAHSGPTAATTRLYGYPAEATTGTLGVNYGLVMCLGASVLGRSATYAYSGTGCAGTGPGIGHTTLPASLAAAMGNSNNAIPFSWAPSRYQQVFLGSEQPVARSYNGLGLRQDNIHHQSVGGVAVDLELHLGYTSLTPATLAATFAANFDSGAPVTVLQRQLVVFPITPPVANTNPGEFFVKIPFNTPFPYAPAAGRNTLIDVIQRGNTNGSSGFGCFLDAHSVPGLTTSRVFGADTATSGTVGPNYGLAMSFLHAGPAGAVPLLANTGNPVLGNNFALEVWQARPSSAAILFHGLSDTSWTFLTLPFDLAGVGAPGCSIRASGEFLFPTPTNASGRGSVSFAIPGDASLIGGAFFNQFVVLDPGANPLGLAVTGGGAGVMGNK